MLTFSRSLVMQRYHHNVSLRENLSYRWRLYKVGLHLQIHLSNLAAIGDGSHHCTMEPLCCTRHHPTGHAQLALWTCHCEYPAGCLSDNAEVALQLLKYCCHTGRISIRHGSL